MRARFRHPRAQPEAPEQNGVATLKCRSVARSCSLHRGSTFMRSATPLRANQGGPIACHVRGPMVLRCLVAVLLALLSTGCRRTKTQLVVFEGARSEHKWALKD